MMQIAKIYLGIVLTLLGLALLLGILARLGVAPLGAPVILLLLFFYGWMLTAFLHYREGRQVEFVTLLTTAAESGAPLAPAVRAYLHDRPRGPLREVWVAALLFFVLPGYYWLWHRRRSYDRRIAVVADRLEQGESLHNALQASPGVVPRETLLAVAVGESTGQLARCLRGSAGNSVTPFLPKIVGRLLYPLALLLFLAGIFMFMAAFIMPKFEKIFKDFGEPLPGMTARVSRLGRLLMEPAGLLGASLLGMLLLVFVPMFSSTFRWFIPGLGRLYRMNVQSRVLRMLGVLLQLRKPVPEALAVLAASDAFAPEARRRLNVSRDAVERGEPLAESLSQGGLLRPAMVPLVQAAERVHNLPWALSELGEMQRSRLARLLDRISAVIFPISVILMGSLVGYVVLAWFLPLIQLIVRLSE